MKKLLKYVSCLAILLMVIVLFTGCKVTGGGWFPNEDNNGNSGGGEPTITVSSVGNINGAKCTFGFNAQGTKTGEGLFDWEYKGQFQFKDHGTGKKIHIGEMMLVWGFDDGTLFGGTDKEGKGVAVFVTDMGEPGPGAGDAIKIWYDLDVGSLFDPPDWVPDWAGTIEGGNIQVHEDKD